MPATPSTLDRAWAPVWDDVKFRGRVSYRVVPGQLSVCARRLRPIASPR